MIDVSALLAPSSGGRSDVRTLRGVRGCPLGEVARATAAAWAGGVELGRDEDALTGLFGTAWEDGLVAIGLLAALVPDAPGDALDLGLSWLDRVDDVGTADALGWLVLGHGALGSGRLGDVVTRGHPMARRAGVMAGMALTPTPIEGPSAAALRARVGEARITFVESPESPALASLAGAFLPDESPPVRKALRRVLGAWALYDPDAAEAWMAGVRGGVPRMLRDEVAAAARKGRR